MAPAPAPTDAADPTDAPTLTPVSRRSGRRAVSGRGGRAAATVSAVFSPAVLGTVCLLLAGWSQGRVAGVIWALIIAAVILGLPMFVLGWLASRGRYDDRFVPRREDRIPVYAAVGALMAAVLVLLGLAGPGLGVPGAVTLTVVLLLAGVLVLLPLTLRWKVSAHSAMAAASAVAVPCLAGGGLILVTWAVPALVAWARVRLGRHTGWQTLVGVWIGLLLGAVYAAVRIAVL